ncbi:MAG: hypothetical protein U0736_00210 [Gemmataceae bacterium]
MKRWLLAAWVAVGVAAYGAPPVEPEPEGGGAVKDLGTVEVKEAAYRPGRPPQPRVLRSEKDAAEHLTADGAAELKKRVDFATQAVLLFAWRGSGQDRPTAAAGKTARDPVTFTYQAGRTRDLRPHARAFAVPSAARWAVALAWEEAKDVLRTAKVASVFQTHDRRVSIHLADGTRYETVEPALDDVIRFIRAIKRDIPIATE